MVLRFVEEMTDLSLKQCSLFLDVQTAKKIVNFGLKAAERCDANFRCWWRLKTSDIGDMTGNLLV